MESRPDGGGGHGGGEADGDGAASQTMVDGGWARSGRGDDGHGDNWGHERIKMAMVTVATERQGNIEKKKWFKKHKNEVKFINNHFTC